MAYFDPSQVFSQFSAAPVAMPQDFLPVLPGLALPGLELAPPERADFDHTEWAVIALARQDGPATLQPRRRSKLGRLLFGAPRTYALSGERLEALRRLAVAAWRRPQTLPLPALGAFIAAGFTSAQLALLLATTGALPGMAGHAPTIASATADLGNAA